MKINSPIAYLLLYAAQIDTEISAEEKKLITEKLENAADLEKVKAEFLNDDAYTRTEKVRAIFRDGNKDALLSEVRALMNADDNFSNVENYLLNLMKKF